MLSIPVLILVGADPGTSLFLRSTVIWINDFVVIVIIFGSLIYSVHIGQDEVNVSAAMSQYSSTISRRATEPDGRPDSVASDAYHSSASGVESHKTNTVTFAEEMTKSDAQPP